MQNPTEPNRDQAREGLRAYLLKFKRNISGLVAWQGFNFRLERGKIID